MFASPLLMSPILYFERELRIKQARQLSHPSPFVQNYCSRVKLVFHAESYFIFGLFPDADSDPSK